MHELLARVTLHVSTVNTNYNSCTLPAKQLAAFGVGRQTVALHCELTGQPSQGCGVLGPLVVCWLLQLPHLICSSVR